MLCLMENISYQLALLFDLNCCTELQLDIVLFDIVENCLVALS